MLPAIMLLDLKHPAYAYVMVIDIASNTFMERCLKTLDSPFSLNGGRDSRSQWPLSCIHVCTALRDPKMWQQTTFGIPMSNNIEFMPVTPFFLDLRAEVKVV